ncbi:General transcription factor 3C polypeptide 1 [Branchiostoma belcheri]|nr:General transcription factor 3C polypeptide 1 [Branchiostoma belcheri]
MDVLEDCLDEVALEGLDGITIPALWLRLERRQPSLRLTLDEFTKPFIWECLATCPSVQIYELPEPRPNLVIRDRDEDTGDDASSEGKALGTADIYPVAMVTKSDLGEKGSCATYKDRRNITDEIRTEDRELRCTLADAVERWNSRLVLVASQPRRERSLFHEGVLPDVEVTDIQYCILERLGRARHQGEVQQDIKMAFGADPKYLFHVRKGLLQYDLITRQAYSYTTPGGARPRNSVLLLLKRFHATRRSRNGVMMDQLIQLLENRPDKMAVLTDLRGEMDLSMNAFKKIYQALEIQGKVKGLLVPTKDIYPDPNDPRILSNNRVRKVIRCLKLVQTAEEDEEGGEEDIDDPEQTVPPYPVVYERPFLNQAYDFMYSRGPLGITQHDLRVAMRLGRYEARGLCRSMQWSGIAVEIMEDRGKVRMSRYVAKSLLDQNQLQKQFEVEQLKNNRLTKRGNKQGDKTAATVSTTPTSTADVSVPSPTTSTSTENTTENTEEGKPASKAASQDVTPKRSYQKIQTYRRLRRTNIILEVLKATKVVHGAFPFVKAIRASEEKEEDFCGVLDKKSVMRLLHEMISGGQVKVIKTIVIQDGMEKPVVFYVEPNVSPTDGMVRSAIEQIKFKMVRGKLPPEKKEKENLPKPSIALESDLQKIEDDITYKPISQHAGVYNFQPKLARLKLAHQFLWYLANVHTDVDKKTEVGAVPQINTTDDQENVVPKGDGPSKDVSALNQSAPKSDSPPTQHPVYMNELSWKWYIPPVPTQNLTVPPHMYSTPCTWMSCPGSDPKPDSPPTHVQHPVYMDELSWKRYIPPFLYTGTTGRAGCCLFCQIIKVPCEVDNMKDYLDDPEKKYTLVRHLPNRMRHQLLHKRKYLYSFHELVERLSAMGLVKIGPRGHKEKDQLFIYLNKNASIVDTTTSSPGYFIVRSDKEFVLRRYKFTSEREVESYWCALECICLNTPLGAIRLREPSAPRGHTGLETWVSRAKLLQFANPEEVIVDDGHIPGDGKGAGGLDSVFFSHLKRNWKLPPMTHGRQYPGQPADWSSASGLSLYPAGVSPRKPKRLPKQVYIIKMPFKSPEKKTQSSSAEESSPRKAKQQLVKVTKVQDSTKDRNKKVKGGKGQKRKREKKQEAPKPTKARKRKASLSSDGPPRKKDHKKEKYHDTRDKAALSRMKRQRVSWTPQEDSLILRCRVASALLNKKVQQSFVPWMVVRDLLHDTFQASEDKTTFAVARRSTYIMKNSQTALNFKICLAEVHQDKDFMSWISSMKEDYTDPKVCEEEYRIVVGRLQEKFSRAMPGTMEELPDTMEELLSKYQIMTVSHHPHNLPPKTVSCIEDIHLQVLRNFIWNCLGASESDKTRFAFLAYKLFNKYPNTVLERAFLSMKKQGLVNQSKGVPARPRVGSPEGWREIRSAGGLEPRIAPKSKVRAVPMAAIGYKLSAIAERPFQQAIPSSVFPEAHQLLTRLKQDRARGAEQQGADEGEGAQGQGVEFPSEGAGGQTACVFSLLATNQLSYTVDIPENIVVIDSSMETPTKEARKTCNKEGSDSEGDTENSNTGAVSLPLATRSSRTKVLAARSGTAPAILSLRNLEPTDNIVINSCTINMRLPRRLFHSEEHRNADNEDQLQTSSPAPMSLPNFLLTDPSASGQDPANNALPWDEFVSLCRQDFLYSDPDVQRLRDIYHYIEAGEGLGVRLLDLQCIEVGIHEPRLVTAEHCGPWFMHSSRLVTMATSPGTDAASRPGTSRDVVDTVLHVTHTPQPAGSTSQTGGASEGTSGETLRNVDGQTKPDQDSTNKSPPNTEDADVTKDADTLPAEKDGKEGSMEERKLRPRVAKTPTPGRRRDRSDSELHVQMQASKYGVYEPVAFLSRPWRAVDGSVNGRVLQNMLQGLLLLILQKPGISQAAVLRQIHTVMPGMAALQLLQMLESMGCITARHIRTAPKAKLFSEPVSLVEGIGDKAEVYYEPTADAILRLIESIPPQDHE